MRTADGGVHHAERRGRLPRPAGAFAGDVPGGGAGCGLCAKKCPIGAIEVRGEEKEAKAAVGSEVCLGCGVCKPACAKGALSMEPRKERGVVPGNGWRRAGLMAIERGKFPKPRLH